MGMTLTERILASKSKKDKVVPGEIIEVTVDRIMVNDFVGPTVCYEFDKDSKRKVIHPDKVLFSTDHSAPPASVNAANNLAAMKHFCSKNGIKRFGDDGRCGISHQLMIENFSRPGEIAVGTDSHATLYGGIGAFGCGITASDAVVAMSVGLLWLKVPESIRIELTGTLRRGVTAKDIALAIFKLAPFNEFNYAAIEITGDGLHKLSVDSRLTIANMLAETGAKNVILESDDIVREYIGDMSAESLKADSDAVYKHSYTLRLEELVPFAAYPHSVENVQCVVTDSRIKADQIFIGSCTNGRIEDLRQAAEILGGRHINQNVRLLVVPASQKVMTQAISLGYITTLIEAGASILVPGCASCAGFGPGMIGDGEVCISTTNRNFKGRMGSMKSEVYLVSAYTAAASALNGYLTNPLEFLKDE